MSTLVEKNGFHLEYLKNDMPESSQVLVDLDAFSQIAINLVDNAVKFSSVENQQSKKQIDLGFSLEGQMAYFSVRGYGPGIAANQSKKIFELFYRSGNELTRTRPGTGIGLALVSELAKDMGDYAQLVNRSPGAEFRVYFLSKSI